MWDVAISSDENTCKVRKAMTLASGKDGGLCTSLG